MTKEIWKPITGFENRYLISNWGRVMSLGRILHAKDGSIRHYKNRILSLKPKKNHGYVAVRLYGPECKISKHINVHRLVALHFIPNPEGYPVVNHLDCRKDNNHINNLEWVDISTNLTYKNAHLKAGEKRRKRVFQYTMDGEFIRTWSWAKEAQEVGFYPHSITKVCLGEIPHYKGYLWSYH